ncbi:MAG: carbohydrate ABC transporter permease [Eubacteriales bacterium]|nr:carbohydrate ABC transporter permease [Eubacteriales bacterium]
MVQNIATVTKNKLAKAKNVLNEKVFTLRVKHKAKNWVWSFVRSIFLLGFAFVIMYPILIMLSRAFMHRVDIYDNTVLWIPKNFSVENFQIAGDMIQYWPAFKNSMILAITITLVQTLSCLLIGYGFARFNFKLRGFLFGIVIFTIIVPPQLLMVPIYLHFRFFDVFGIYKAVTGNRGINLLDTFSPFYLLAITGQGIKNGLFIYIFRQFFRGMPKETEEAAVVDGAGPFKTFTTIMVPGALTAITTVALFSFVWQWNDNTYASLFLKNTKVLPLTYEFLGMFTPEMAAEGMLTTFDTSNPYFIAMLRSTGVLMMIAPVIILYIFAQKFFVESIERAGIIG